MRDITPGAVPVTLKLLFDLDGNILGAQAVGQEGVDKRIDVLAGAMRSGHRQSGFHVLDARS